MQLGTCPSTQYLFDQQQRKALSPLPTISIFLKMVIPLLLSLYFIGVATDNYLAHDRLALQKLAIIEQAVPLPDTCDPSYSKEESMNWGVWSLRKHFSQRRFSRYI